MAKGLQNWRATLEVGVLFWKIFGTYHIFERNQQSFSSLLVNNIPVLMPYKREIGCPYVGHRYLHGFPLRRIELHLVPNVGDREG